MNKVPNGKYRKIFLALIILYFVYFLCNMPGYILEKCLGYPDEMYYKFWKPLNNFLHGDKVLNYLYHLVLYKIPAWTIYPVIILNAANMIFGFIHYKKKWWYYLVLALSILCSVLLLDYYEIYTYDDV